MGCGGSAQKHKAADGAADVPVESGSADGAQAPAAPAAGGPAPAAVVEMFGETLASKDGTVQTSDLLGGKDNIMIYFSAHWCPPCRGFTPTLAEAYKASSKAGKSVVVIFVSSDKDDAAFKEYYGEMPWHAMPYDKREAKETLSNKFGVNGIPMLIVLDGQGNLITAQGRGEFAKYL